MGRAWPALDLMASGRDPSLRDRLLAALDDFHPTALEEPDDESRLRAYFPTAALRDAAARAIATAFGDQVASAAHDVPDEGWAERSQAGLNAVTVGTLIIAPPWQAALYRGLRSRLVIISPSMGFGTGHHATTRLMLHALQALTLDDKTMLDLGCGSGVLALAAAKLGAARALGIDCDPDAFANALDNLALNAPAGDVRFELGDFQQLREPADVVAANLTGALLASSATALAALVKPGGHLVVSGLLDDERHTVLPALDHVLAVERVDQDGEWLCATYKSRHT